MTIAEQIVTRLLEAGISPASVFRAALMRNLTISEKPHTTDGRKVYGVRLTTPDGVIPIGTIYQDTYWKLGWSAYEVYSQRVRDNYAGRYYVNGRWFKSPEEAAADLRRQWERT